MKGKLSMILLLSLLLSGALQPGVPLPEREKALSKMIANWLANWHYSGRKIDDDFSAKSFAQFTKYLDNGKNFLIQADLEALKPYTHKIDDGLLGGDFTVPRLGQELLRQRVLQVQGFAREILSRPFDFSLDDSIELDADKRETSRDLDQLRSWWGKWLKYLTLTQYINLQKAAQNAAPSRSDGWRDRSRPDVPVPSDRGAAPARARTILVPERSASAAFNFSAEVISTSRPPPLM